MPSQAQTALTSFTMQALLLLVSIATSALAEAPSNIYGAPFRAAPSSEFGGPVQSLSFSAVAPAGFRPVGTPFFLPSRPSAAYYEPQNDYLPPPPPVLTTAAPTTTTEVPTTTTELPTTTESAIELSGASSLDAHRGVYYILQPDGRLQRIAYAHGPAPARYSSSSQQAQQNPGFLARFQYHDLEPQGAPIYSYNQPQLIRIN